MVGGQVEDLAQENGNGTLHDLENIHACKTGALFRACLRLGVWTAQGEKAGGADPVSLSSLDEYGRCFGQAFQITDDLLDVEGDAAQTGKRVQKDAARGKLTYPRFLGAAESRRRAEQLARQASEHLRPFGERGRHLVELMQSVLQRDR
jgi:geranylgeranyl pyrophosphate synthase